MEPQIFKTRIARIGDGLHRSQMCVMVILLSIILWAVPVRAEENINVNLRIEAPSQTILNQQVSVPYSCEVTDSAGATSTYTGYKAICALQSAQEQGMLTYNASNFGFGLFIEKINNIGNDANKFWSLYQDNSASTVGATDLELSNEERTIKTMILSYVDWNYSNEILGITLSSSTIYTNSSTTLQAQMWNGTEFVNFNSPVSFFINGSVYDAPSGALEYTPDTDGQKEIYVEAVGKTRSEKVYLTTNPILEPEIVLPTTTIHLHLETYNETLYNDNFIVTACAPDSNTTSTSLTPYCALQQIAQTNAWNIGFSDYGGAKFLSYINNFNGADYNWWAFFHNSKTDNVNFASEALNQYTLNTLDKKDYILLSYGIFPLKIAVSSTTPALNTTTTISTKEFGFDGEWKPAWISAVSSTLVFGEGEEVNNDSGAYELFITTTTPYTVYGKKSGFLDSTPITIIGQEPTVEELPTEDNPPDNGGGGGGGNNNDEPPANPTVSDADIKTAVDKILTYLKSQQDATGKIIDGGTTDWAIMSLGANGQYADELLNFAKTYNFTDSSDMNLCAGYPRHILTLLAAGVPVDDSVILNLKSKINSECYKDNLYGQNGINDDVFGVLALLAIGVSPTEPIVQSAIDTIRADQTADGAFTWAGYAGADITGAAINALKYAETKGASIDPLILTKAKTYLKTTQLEDGGWGFDVSDPMTTSWVMMGINMLGEKQNDWTKENKNPWHVLTNQLVDGRYIVGSAGETDWFSTKHAVPALLGKSWPIILPPRVTPPVTQPATGGATQNTDNITQTPTTTLFITPTTTAFAVTPTTTPTTTLEHTSTSAPEHLSTPTETITTTTIDSELQITNYKLQIPNNDQILNPDTNLKSSILNLQSETLSPAPPEIPPEPANPVSSAAKKLFAGSSIAAGGLGLYLAWRLLQTVV